MKIVPRYKLMYIPKFGFIHFPKMIRSCIVAFMITFTIAWGYLPSPVEQASANQVVVTRFPPTRVETKEDKITAYILGMNKTVDVTTAKQLADAIMVKSVQYHIPVELQLGLITVESRFDQYAVSTAGALGWFQIMPGVHQDKILAMKASGEISTKNIYDPLTQASLGNRILSDCLNKHKSLPRSLQCYNGSRIPTEYSLNVINAAKRAKAYLI